MAEACTGPVFPMAAASMAPDTAAVVPVLTEARLVEVAAAMVAVEVEVEVVATVAVAVAAVTAVVVDGSESCRLESALLQ